MWQQNIEAMAPLAQNAPHNSKRKAHPVYGPTVRNNHAPLALGQISQRRKSAARRENCRVLCPSASITSFSALGSVQMGAYMQICAASVRVCPAGDGRAARHRKRIAPRIRTLEDVGGLNAALIRSESSRPSPHWKENPSDCCAKMPATPRKYPASAPGATLAVYQPKDTFFSRPMKATPAAEPITSKEPPVAEQYVIKFHNGSFAGCAVKSYMPWVAATSGTLSTTAEAKPRRMATNES
mmetsp:Transcript_136857/g.437827  ORF Transcript_136857/g.437827 Transcript_136857/m.437827 type:complete len:240 (+) Transcript_136857:110-829(+)